MPVAALSARDAEEVSRALGSRVHPDLLCLSLRATRGAEGAWNDRDASKRHRVLPVVSGDRETTPMVSALVTKLGVPTRLLRTSQAPEHADDSPDAQLPWLDVFHVEVARGSPLVPDQADFVERHGVASVVGFAGVLPDSQVFVVILFSCVPIGAERASLFRTMAPSVALALASGATKAPSDARLCIYEALVREHETLALARLEEARAIRAELETSLRERERFAALVEGSSDFIGIADPQGRVEYLNPAGRRMVGVAPGFDVRSTHVLDYVPARLRDEAENIVMPKTFHDGTVAMETFLRDWRTNGEISVAAHHFVIREGETGNLAGVGTVMRDVTEQKRAAEERERLLASAEVARSDALNASRAKDDFLALLGHELRNPLSPILTALGVMKLRGFHSPEQDVIERQAIHLARLVDDLLDVGRIVRGQIDVQKKPLEIAAAVERALEMVSPAIERRKQVVRVEVPQRGLLVCGDLGRLAQVVCNLLDNASKYSPAGTEIFVSAARRGDVVQLVVRDRGMGIPKAKLETIFEPFVRQEQTTDGRSASGLGLGLSIVRSLVKLHGGTVCARSEGSGKGTEIAIELPLMTQPTAAPDPEDHALRPSGRHKRVLVVDDNEDAAEMLSEALIMLGHDVSIAHDGPQALIAARNVRPEVILLDIGLPVMDGYEVAKRLRDLPEVGAGARIVAVTGFGQEDDRRRSREAGFAAHLVKPIALQMLTEVV
jgi:PAS domain S-box-containing protein